MAEDRTSKPCPVSMLRVAYDITSFAESPFGGIAQVCANTITQAAAAPDIEPVGFYKAGDPDNCRIDGVAVRKLTPFSSLIGPSYDIAHSLCHRRLKVRASRSVYTVHDVWSLQPNRYQSAAFQKKVGARLRRDILEADFIVTISETTRQNLLALELVAPERCQAVHLGVDMPRPSEPSEISPDLAPVFGKRYVIYVGSLEIRKNIGHLLEALRALKDVDLVLAGRPGFGYRDNIEARIKQFPPQRLHLLPKVNRKDLALFYQNAVAMILPSFEEGFGLPIVEAMACSCPVITSNRSANAEIGGEAAILVDPEAPQESRLAVGRLIDDDEYRDRIIAAGHSWVKQFRWDEYYRELLAIYRALLG